MRIAIVGSGQLARMMAEAGKPLNFECVFLASPAEDCSPVEGMGDIVIPSLAETAEQLYEALGKPDVITVEKEDVDVELLKALNGFCPVYPNPDTLSITKNRINEKTFLADNHFPVAGFRIINSTEQLFEAAEALGLPLVLKAAEQGYDGKSQWRIFSEQDLKTFAENFPQKAMVAEQWVNFSKELSVIGARSVTGETRFYAVAENRHENGILVTSKVRLNSAASPFERQAQEMLGSILTKLDYVGVLAMECFVVGHRLFINELAPRVHNSGHWTQSGTRCSQFENHLRAICGMPLGDTRTMTNAAMVNILGVELSKINIAIPDAKLHWYNKSHKPGRKLGHINLIDSHPQLLEEKVQLLEQHLYSKVMN